MIHSLTGTVMIVNAHDDYDDTEQHRAQLPIDKVETTEAIDIGLIVGGILLTLFGFILVALYIKVAEWRRSCVCPCGLSKKQGLARQLQGGQGGTQILPLNPSTDPLVSHTQYAPVSELPRPDDEECRTLMTDNKDWWVILDTCSRWIHLNCHYLSIYSLSSAEESDRMLDPDPRIVLRPIGHVEDAWTNYTHLEQREQLHVALNAI